MNVLSYSASLLIFTLTAVIVNFDMSTYTFTEGFIGEVCVNITEGSTERTLEIQLSSTDVTAKG